MLGKTALQNLPCGQLVGWSRKSVTCKAAAASLGPRCCIWGWRREGGGRCDCHSVVHAVWGPGSVHRAGAPARGTRNELERGGQERLFRVRSVLSCRFSDAEVTPEPRTCLWLQECPAGAQDSQPPKPVSYALFTWRPSPGLHPAPSTPGCPHTSPRGRGTTPPPACPSPRGQSVSLGNPLIYSLLQNLFLCK